MAQDYKYEKRRYIITLIAVAIVLVYLGRLFGLQVLDGRYKDYADSNAFLKKAIYPSRGEIFDRNGRIVVYNRPAYDIMLIPRNVSELDTAAFCEAVGIDRETFDRRMVDMRDRRLNPGYSSYTPQKFITHLSAEDYGKLQEKMYRFPGFYIQKRILRDYAYDCAGNILGNIREVSQADIDRDDYYSPGDYTGDLGIEKSFENYLRGHKGAEILIRDANGRIQGRYEEGARDVAPIAGKALTLSIDIELQQYAESLMFNKIGAVVAIEPETGEILCMVSAPTYNPSSLVGRQRGKNYQALRSDPLKPLFDRALMGAYPPGSTFKPSQGLILRQEGIIDLNTAYPCYHGYISGRLKVGCHGHGSPLTLQPALQTSCNAFFCWGLKHMLDKKSKYGSTAEAFETWKRHLVSLGYGYRLGVDLPGEGRGFLPNAEFYNKWYGAGHWSANTIISVAIGQGEVLATPLQIANMAATVANRGWFVTPHVVKAIEDTIIAPEFVERRFPTIDSRYFDEVATGMRMAVTGGTCRLANLPDIEVCGKTGTAQNPHGRDHSAFMGFAPYHNPKIAVAVYVENAGFGATYGVPIGSLIMEKYLTGRISPSRKYIEENMLNSNTIIYSGVRRH